MALTTPILNTIVPFDATQSYNVTFNVVGGDQVVGNTIVVTNASTGAQVYTNTATSFVFSNTIPANTLVNGTYYSVTVKTQNALGYFSAVSTPVSFYCYATPVVTAINFTSGGTINNANYVFQLQYTQEQSEPLESYSIILYSTANVQIATSGVVYTGSSTVPLTVSYEFSGMTNATVYSVGLTGVTLHGMPVVFAPIQFTVQYGTPAVYSLINLTNNCDGGYVTIQSNIQNINGTSNPSPPIYINHNSVSLRTPNSYVEWADGYNIDGNFTLRMWLTNPSPTDTISVQKSADGLNIAKIRFRTGNPPKESVLKWYVDAEVTSGGNGVPYYIFSNYIAPPAYNDKLMVLFRKINNIYTLTLQNLGG